MPRVKVHHRRQITLPEEVREKLGVSEGDQLDIEFVDEGVLLKPVTEADRDAAWEKLFAAAAEVRDVAPKPGQSPRDEEEEIAEAVKAFRREHV